MKGDEWVERLVEAVDADNGEGVACDASRTLDALCAAPRWAREHVALAVADFGRAGSLPLASLRSDAVASGFSVRTAGELNTLVARLVVPGGPWPGHYGLEAVVFTAHAAIMPDWFPAPRSGHGKLHFAAHVAWSAAFRDGAGAVVFPELLSRSDRLAVQAFGIAFIDRLAALYVTSVVPLARALGLDAGHAQQLLELREIAFLAHEWGHLAVDGDYMLNADRYTTPLLAPLSELAADMSALAMLLSCTDHRALDAARVLVLDRILRDAWLPRSERQIASLTALMLLRLLTRTGVVQVSGGSLRVHLERAASMVGEEVLRISSAHERAAEGDIDAVRRYFATLDGSRAPGGCGFARPSRRLT